MMNNYKADITEIIAFCNCIFSEGQNIETCFSRLCEDTGEEYLDGRKKALLEAIDNDAAFRNALTRLSSVCSEDDSRCDSCQVRKYCNHYINRRRKDTAGNNHLMVDLFCGAGGLSLGFTQEGFITALANDIEPCCVDTYALNHPETSRTHIILGDIREVVDNLQKLLGDLSIDVVVGGPPCQGFSMANRQRLIDDPRNMLYKNFVKAVELIHPAFFVMENVKGMRSVAQQVVEDFERIGYNVSYRVLNAMNYGVPQNRERLIYIGNRIGVKNNELFSELEEISRSTPSYVLKDALYGLRKLEASRNKNATENGSVESGSVIEPNPNPLCNEYVNLINQGRTLYAVCNHQARYNNDRDIEIFRRLNPGDKSDDPKIADIMPYARRNAIFKDKYYKLQPDRVCKTITAHMKFDCNMYIHPTQARGLTPREAARVQSYPDDYYFRGPFTKTYMQIGNSVPPLLGRAIATVIKKRLEGCPNSIGQLSFF